jgi:IS30 family transposase
MAQLNCTTAYHHLSAEQRGQLEQIVRIVGLHHVNKAKAARALGVSRTTVARELSRNTVTLMKRGAQGQNHFYETYESPNSTIVSDTTSL